MTFCSRTAGTSASSTRWVRGTRQPTLRRQASAQNEHLVQSKALTDEDVRMLRQEMREFLAKFHRIQDSFGEKP